MKLFCCPASYRAKPYGCGFGPVNATRAFLDYMEHCPRCKRKLVPYTERKALAPEPNGTCIILGLTGSRYCMEPAYRDSYCKRHQHVRF